MPRPPRSSAEAGPMTPEQRKANRRLALILLTVALAFGVGFV
ncbi:cytochrome oxidase small assembly protein, partial [Escherichia coli]